MSAINYTVTVDDSQLKKLEDLPEVGKKAMSTALNKTLNRVVRTTTEEVNAEYSPLRRGVKSAMTLKRANWNKLEAEAIFTGRQIKASGFSRRIPKNRYRAPVALKVKKNFVTSSGNPVIMFGGHGREVFRRRMGTDKVETAYTLSIPQMVSNEVVYQRVAEDAQNYLRKEFDKELIRRVNLLIR